MDRIVRGDVWVVEPALHPKARPALVVSINPINDLCPDVLLIPITTKPGPLRIELSESPEATGLKSKSFAKCESVGPVHKSRMKRRIGRVPSSDLRRVDEGLKTVLGLGD